MPRFRIASALVFCLIVVGVIGAVAMAGGGAGGQRVRISALPGVSTVSAGSSDGSTAKFAFLARQTSNSCGLEPSALAGMPSRMRLQGSCCFPMNLAAYKSQVRGLRAYSGLSAIPGDPYDVPVSLAKQMLQYDRTIRLSTEQTQTYSRAMRIATTKGPCCCRCWRWYAFRGLSKHLIADRGWTAKRIAAVIDLLEGCGGPADHA